MTLLVFDVLRLDGRDLMDEPLGDAAQAPAPASTCTTTAGRRPPAYDDGPMLFDATLQQGLEGIVSKRLSSRYRPGLRSKDWLKFAHRRRDSYVVGGWRPQRPTRRTGSAARARGRADRRRAALPRPRRQRDRRQEGR